MHWERSQMTPSSQGGEGVWKRCGNIATKLPLKLEAPHYPSKYPSQSHGPSSLRGKSKFTPHYPSHQSLPLSFIKNLGKFFRKHHLYLEKSTAAGIYSIHYIIQYTLYNIGKSSSDRLLRVVRPAPCFARAHDCLQRYGQATLPFTPHIPLTTIPNNP